MKGLIGLICAVAGGWIGWWAFNKAAAGNDSYNAVWIISFIICAFGIILVLARIRNWVNK